MPGIKITELGAIADLTASDLMECVDVSVATNKKATLQDVADFVGPNLKQVLITQEDPDDIALLVGGRTDKEIFGGTFRVPGDGEVNCPVVFHCESDNTEDEFFSGGLRVNIVDLDPMNPGGVLDAEGLRVNMDLFVAANPSGAALFSGNAAYALFGASQYPGSDPNPGEAAGVFGVAAGNYAKSFGVIGSAQAIDTVADHVALGVAGMCVNAISTTNTRIGLYGYIGPGNGGPDPVLESSVLLLDNTSSGLPLLTALVDGELVAKITGAPQGQFGLGKNAFGDEGFYSEAFGIFIVQKLDDPSQTLNPQLYLTAVNNPNDYDEGCEFGMIASATECHISGDDYTNGKSFRLQIDSGVTSLLIDSNKVVGPRVIDAGLANSAAASYDANTRTLINALRNVILTHELGAAA